MPSLKLISWNVNGLRAVWRKGFPDFVKTHQPDILALQETKIDDNSLDMQLQNLPGYSQANFNCAQHKKGYSGVATFSKLAPKKVTTSLSELRFDQEGRVLISDYQSFSLFNIYFPNGKASPARLQYKLDFYQHFLTWLKTNYLAKNRPVIICGDVNTAHQPVDLARPKENSEISGFLPIERAWLDQLLAAGLIDTFRYLHPTAQDQYSWWSFRSRARERNVGWRIDYFFISQDLSDRLRTAFILPAVTGSDHCPIGIELALP